MDHNLLYVLAFDPVIGENRRLWVSEINCTKSVICIAIWPSAAKLFGRVSATLFVIDSEVLT